MNVVTAYGVGIESEFALGALSSMEVGTPAEQHLISIHVQRVASIERDQGSSVRACTAQNRAVHIVSHSDHVTVQVDLLFDFKLYLASNRMDCSVLPKVPDAVVRYWILQQILPLFLLLNGSTEFLHGMAVRTHPAPQATDSHHCIAFLGESHAGKSTLLNFFLGKGHALVTDDHLALSRRSYSTVLPAPPFFRAYRAAEDLGTRAAIYSPAPTELRRLYLVQPAPPDAPPRLEPLTGMAALAALFPNLHYSLHNPAKPDFFPLVEDRFRGLADLIRRVPFARLHIPRSLDRLPEVYDFIQTQQAS